jgi:hypothetical protein
MADTLLTVATDELQHSTDAQGKVALDQVQAPKDFVQARTDLDQAAADLKALSEQADGIRRQIAQTTVAAEGEQLFADLEAKNADVRAKQAEIARLQEALADAGSRVAASQDEGALAAAEVKAATAAVDEATKRDADNTAWRTAATAATLAGLPAACDVTQAGAAQTAKNQALARLDESSGGDLPHELFVRAEERRQRALKRLDVFVTQARAAEQRQADVGATTGLTGKREQTRLAFERGETALKDFALTASARRDRALALLRSVAGSTPMSDPEKQRLMTLRDEAKALQDAATLKGSFTLASEADQAQEAVDENVDATAAARLDALANDPSANTDADPAVVALKAALTPLNTALTDAQGALTAPMKSALAALDAAVPDTTWALLDDYEEALSLLADIAALDPAVLADTAPETAYAQALRAEQDNAHAVETLGRGARQSADRADAYAPTRPARLLQALRGDE